MKHPSHMIARLSRLMIPTLAVIVTAITAHAVPYASSITNTAGTISYLLNEGADNVTVVFDGGGAGNTNDLGAQAVGPHSFTLTTHTNYLIQVKKSSATAWTKTSDETNNVGLRFFSPRGVAVNASTTNLQSFGRIYVSTATPGTGGATTTPTSSQRFTGRGLYVLNPDYSDPFGQGTNVRNAGITFDISTLANRGVNSPWRLKVAPDGSLYVADFSTNTGTIYKVNPDVTSSVQVLAGQGKAGNPTVHTTIGGLIIRGSTNTSDLVVYATDGSFPGSLNRVLRWDVGAGSLPWNTAPSATLGCPGICSVVQVVTDVDMAPDGKFYTCENRSAGTDADSIRVFDTDGTTQLWGSLAALGSPDPLKGSRCVKVSPDGKLIAIITDANDLRFLPLTNGIPDMAQLQTITGVNAFGGAGTAGRDVGFDAAGNLYAVSSGMEKMVVFSPGGTSTTITSGNSTDSSGTFNTVKPTVQVSVTVADAAASEAGPDTGTFTINAVNVTVPVVVSYTLSGTATNGVDYTTLSGSVTIDPSISTSTNVVVTPIDDSVVEFTETVILSLAPSSDYSIVAPSTGTILISDNETSELSITNVSTQMYERTNDFAVYRITRKGNTNASSFTVNFAFTGTATSGVDFYADAVTIDPGDVTKTFKIYPINDALVEGSETVTNSLAAAGAGEYTIGSPGTAGVVTIVDSTLPPEAVQFSDDFNTDTSTNWIIRFASANGIDDYSAQFNYDYSVDSIPSAPHSAGDTHGLRVTVNKSEATALGAAGINLYPTNQSFSGDYALRFDMYLTVGPGGSATEYALFGINHSGNKTNWFRDSTTTIAGTPGASYDGLFCIVEADAANLGTFNSSTTSGDYVLASAPAVTVGTTVGPSNYVHVAANAFTSAFKSPPWNVGGAGGGVAANSYNNTAPIWADVELSQVSGVITLKVNNTTILTSTNKTGFTSGNIMLGYDDGFDSVGPSTSVVIFDNVRVVTQGSLAINKTGIAGTDVQIDFTDSTTGPWTLLTATGVSTNSADYSAVGAVFTTVSGGHYRATTPYSKTEFSRFYRVRRN